MGADYIYLLYTPRTWGHSLSLYIPNESKAALIKHVRERAKGAVREQ